MGLFQPRSWPGCLYC